MTEDEARDALESLNPEDVILEKGSLLVVTTEEYNLVLKIEPEKLVTNNKTNKGEEEVIVEPENYVVEIHLIREKATDSTNPGDTEPDIPQEPDEPVVDPETPDDGENESGDDNNTSDDNEGENESEEPSETPGDIGSGILGAIGTLYIVISIISGAVCILMIVAQWRIYVKAGEKGWKCLIPIYGQVVFFKISMGRGIFFLSWIIPPVGAILTLIATYRLFQKFDKSTLFCIAGVFFSPIMMLVVAFDNSCYEGQPLPAQYQKDKKTSQSEKHSSIEQQNQQASDGNQITPPPVPPRKPAKSSRFGKKSNPKDEGAFK
jgi:hypothetical protein